MKFDWNRKHKLHAFISNYDEHNEHDECFIMTDNNIEISEKQHLW